MAVIQYTALVSEIRGKVAGSVLSKFSTGFSLYLKGSPRKTKTSAQLGIMSGLTTNSRTWKQLTDLQQLAWTNIASTKPQTDRFGNTIFLTGYQYYRKIIQLVYPAGQTIPINPDPLAGDAQEINFTVASLNFVIGNDGTLIDSLQLDCVTINATSAVQSVILWISLPITALQSSYFKTYYRVVSIPTTGQGSAGSTFSIDTADNLMPLGFYTFEGAIHKIKLQYVVPGSGSISVKKFATIQGSEIPPIEFPTPTLIITETQSGSCWWLTIEWNFVPFFTLSAIPSGWPADFQVSLSFGPIVSGNIPPTGNVWGPERLQAIQGPTSGVNYFTEGPEADPVNNGLIMAASPGSPVGIIDPYLGTRLRFYHIPTNTYGPYWEMSQIITII